MIYQGIKFVEYNGLLVPVSALLWNTTPATGSFELCRNEAEDFIKHFFVLPKNDYLEFLSQSVYGDTFNYNETPVAESTWDTMNQAELLNEANELKDNPSA